MRRARARWIASPVVLALGLPLAACAGGAGAAPGTAVDLVRAGCPAEVRILADSDPRVEQGALYQLLGDEPVIDAATRSVTAPLEVHGEKTGVRLTIVSNEEFGDIPTNERLHRDHDLLLAAVDADAAIVDADLFPTVAVFAPLERDPQVILWDPETFPGARSIAEIGVSFAFDGLPVPVLGAPRNLALDYLAGSGLLAPEQPLREYDGTTDAFVAARGQRAQQGEITTDPRRLQLRADWNRTVRYELIDEAGYPRYPALLSARPDDISRYADCFRALVPLLQRATVEFVAEPAPTTALIVEVAAEYGTSPDYDLAAATRAANVLVEYELMDNGDDDTIGDIDRGRMQLLFDVATPVFEELGYEITPGLTPGDISTDAFIDPSIGL